MNLDTMIRQCQAAVGAKPDGQPGIDTWTRIHSRLVPQPDKVTLPEAPAADTVDPRSELAISTLHPKVRPYARALVQKAAAQGITIKVLSGLRTYAEQDALFNKKPPVTKARGGYSNHNFGIAFDIGVFQGAKYLEESPIYKAVGALGKDLGLEWGGSWKSFVDEPHFQLRPNWAAGMAERDMLAELRNRKAAGKDAFA